MSIASEITRLQNAKAALKESITAKGVTVEDSAKLDEYPALVDSIPSGGGGGGGEYKDVLFLDYDGTITNQYTKSEFLNLTELPSNPDHTGEGLVSQGWNYNLEDAQTYVNKYGKLNIGQLYITSDNKTKIIVNIPFDDFTFKIKPGNSGTTRFDWGDGTIDTQNQNNAEHTYLTAGIYTILIGTGEDIISVNGWNAQNICFNDTLISSCVTKIFFGTVNTQIGGLYNLINLEILTLPKNSNLSVVYGSYGFNNLLKCIICDSWFIGSGTCKNCRFLKFVSLRSCGSFQDYTFQNCNSLISITIPDGVTSIGDSSFINCYKLTNIIIPDGVTNIGANSFTDCRSLINITIPNGVTSIKTSLFNGCCNLIITIPDGVTSIGDYAFANCYKLTDIIIPDRVTSIGSYTFQNCYNLTNIIIPNGLTSIKDNMFSNCSNLISITIPNGVTSIKSYAFQNCQILTKIYCLNVTPPTITTNTFYNIYANSKIYVPSESVEAYKTATNWSAYADKIFAIPTE